MGEEAGFFLRKPRASGNLRLVVWHKALLHGVVEALAEERSDVVNRAAAQAVFPKSVVKSFNAPVVQFSQLDMAEKGLDVLFVSPFVLRKGGRAQVLLLGAKVTVEVVRDGEFVRRHVLAEQHVLLEIGRAHV